MFSNKLTECDFCINGNLEPSGPRKGNYDYICGTCDVSAPDREGAPINFAFAEITNILRDMETSRINALKTGYADCAERLHSKFFELLGVTTGYEGQIEMSIGALQALELIPRPEEGVQP